MSKEDCDCNDRVDVSTQMRGLLMLCNHRNKSQ